MAVVAQRNQKIREAAASAILNSDIPGREVGAGLVEMSLAGTNPVSPNEVDASANNLPIPFAMAISESVLLGKEGESAARGIAEKLGENFGEKTRIDSLTGTALRRFPDGQTQTTLSEVKNSPYVRFTNQLKDYLLSAEKNGQRFILYVRSEATKLAKALEGLIESGRIERRYLGSK